MKSTIRISLGAMGLAAVLTVGAAAQSVVYVIPSEADIRGGTGLGGPTVATVTRGTALTVVEASRLRYLVRTPDGKEGYITARQVQEAPPEQKKGLGGLIKDDRDVAEMRTAATNRGLVGDEAKSMAESEGLNPAVVESVQAMEDLAVHISDAEVDRFMLQGGLNP